MGDEAISALARSIHATFAPRAVPPEEPPVQPTAPIVAATRVIERGDLSASLKKLLSLPIPEIKSNKYGTTKLFHRLSKNTTDWPDNKLENLRGISLSILESDKEVRKLGKEMMMELQSRMTAQTIGKLFQVAFNLKTSAGTHAFGDGAPSDIEIGVGYVEISDLSTFTLSTGNEGNIFSESPSNPTEDVDFQCAVSYSFIAASYLRLFTKAPENYKKIQEHLKNRFSNFYSFEIALKDFAPSATAVKQIHLQFSNNQVFKDTMYRMLYHGAACTDGENLKEFLYGLHLEYTGLAAYTLFTRCTEFLRVDNITLLNALDGSGFTEQLDAIQIIYNDFIGNSDLTHAKGMWKYARIFDRSFLSGLQPKNCAEFLAMLAHTLHEKAPGQNGRILEMKALEDLSPATMTLAKNRAVMLIRVIEHNKTQDGILSEVRPYD